MDVKSFGTKEDLEKQLEEARAKQTRVNFEIEALRNELDYLLSTTSYLENKLGLFNCDTYKGLMEQCDTER